MNIVFGILTILFGGLHGFAAVAQMRSRKGHPNDILMLCGSIVTLIGGLRSCLAAGTDWLNALAGLALIILAAILNGMQQEFHIRHHIVRIVIAAALFIGLLFT